MKDFETIDTNKNDEDADNNDENDEDLNKLLEQI